MSTGALRKIIAHTFKSKSHVLHRNNEVHTCINRLQSTLAVSSCTNTASKWNRAVLDAEKVVGYPTSYFSLRCLLSDEISSIALQLRKLLGTNHPLLKIAKFQARGGVKKRRLYDSIVPRAGETQSRCYRESASTSSVIENMKKSKCHWRQTSFSLEIWRLIYNGRNNMQTRGLIVLLVSKAAGHPIGSPDYLEANRCSGISQRQRSLAEITEMVHTAHLIHKGILNLSVALVPDQATMDDLQFGNNISILGGDYLLANACTLLAELRNCKVVDLISHAIADFMQSQFFGDYDKHGNSLPEETVSRSVWEQQNFLQAGSLMARACQATLELAGYDAALQEHAHDFGKSIGLAMQVHQELQPFVDLTRLPPGTPFSLTSAPVILHLQDNPSLLDYIRANGTISVENLDFKKIHAVISESDAVEKTKVLLGSYTSRAEENLRSFKTSDATKVLGNMIDALRE